MAGKSSPGNPYKTMAARNGRLACSSVGSKVENRVRIVGESMNVVCMVGKCFLRPEQH